MISWKKVLQCFEEADYHLLNTSSLYQEYWYLRTLYRGLRADDDTVLYVIRLSDVPYVSFAENIAVIVINDTEGQPDSEQPSMKGNAILLNEQKELSKGFLNLEAEFHNQFKIGYIMQKLLDVVASDGGIQLMIEMISDFFKEPIALLDTTFRFIARSETYKPISGKSIFSDDAHYGEGYNKSMLEYFKKNGLLEAMLHANAPFHFKVKEEEIAYYMPVIVNKIKVAYLIIYSNQPEYDRKDYYLEFLPLFSQMISIELAKRNFYLFNKGTYYNYIFSLILSDAKVDVEDVRMRLNIYGYDLRYNLYLLEVDSNIEEIKSLHKDKIAESIRNTFRNSFYVFKEDRVFFLISRHKDELLTFDEMEGWNMSLESQNLIGAMTGPFTDFADIHKHMKEVRMVLDAVLQTDNQKNLYTFEEYQTKSMISYLKQEDISLFLYKPVLDLIAYDERHGTELVETLKEYLKYPKEIALICDALCIHKNTLYKRLDRIDSIMNCDYRNGTEIMKIELTLEMLGK